MNLSDTTIGIVIGSGFTVLGVIVQGAISWFLNWRTHKMTLHEQREKEILAKVDEIWHKKEEAYKNFADIIGISLMMTEAAAKQAPYPVSESVKKGCILEKMSASLASIQLYGSPMIADEVHKFVQHMVNSLQYQKPSVQKVANLDMALQELTSKMKEELLQHNIGKRVD